MFYTATQPAGLLFFATNLIHYFFSSAMAFIITGSPELITW